MYSEDRNDNGDILSIFAYIITDSPLRRGGETPDDVMVSTFGEILATLTYNRVVFRRQVCSHFSYFGSASETTVPQC